ncbi:MAG TPA: CAP domain-containing protein [Cyanobacteria bacterium UBA8543]|nr:CAP domain-containing protein [Cyanobacteria bacterium UBA8543]
MKKTASVLLALVGLQLGLNTLLPQNIVSAQGGQTLTTKITVTPLEKSIFEETNKIRANPQSYIPILEAFKARNIPGTNNFKRREGDEYNLETHEGVKAIDEAIEYLRNQKPVPVLERSVGLTMAAKDYAADQKDNISEGHNGNDGSTMETRLKRYGKIQGTAGENLSFRVGHHNNSGQDVVVALIVDDNVPNRGHRKNIFNPQYKKTGVACGEQKQMDNICVMDYASAYEDN